MDMYQSPYQIHYKGDTVVAVVGNDRFRLNSPHIFEVGKLVIMDGLRGYAQIEELIPHVITEDMVGRLSYWHRGRGVPYDDEDIGAVVSVDALIRRIMKEFDSRTCFSKPGQLSRNLYDLYPFSRKALKRTFTNMVEAYKILLEYT
jgi:hypothetical protein